MSGHHAHVSYEAFAQTAAAARDGLTALSRSVEAAGLDKGLIELVKLRASQLNGCAFCVQYHLNLARKLGVEGRKLDLLVVWREAGIYGPREMAALAWAEQLTGINRAAVPDDGFAALRAEFSEDEAIFLTVAVATINAWNRIGAGLRFTLPPSA